MPQFRKKPVVIEAVQWTGENFTEVKELNGSRKMYIENDRLIIETLEGEMAAQKNDWIIRGVAGEIYPCKPEIFKKTYEAV